MTLESKNSRQKTANNKGILLTIRCERTKVGVINFHYRGFSKFDPDWSENVSKYSLFRAERNTKHRRMKSLRLENSTESDSIQLFFSLCYVSILQSNE